MNRKRDPKKLFQPFGPEQKNSVAVLASGGLDSSVLLAEEAEKGKIVYPIFIRAGLCFEEEQFQALRKFLKKIGKKNIRPITELFLPVQSFFPKNHWALTGKKIPPLNSPTGSCYLPGWTLLMLAPTFVFAAQKGISTVILGHLKDNPYPDGQISFISAMEKVSEEAFWKKIKILRPYEKLNKSSVIKRGERFPLHLTLTCINSKNQIHCGRCNKCAERHQSFIQAKVQDPTVYSKKIVL